MGMVMETGANVILLAPILLPIALKFGIHPIHFALIMLVNLSIGLTTPLLEFVFLLLGLLQRQQWKKLLSELYH